MFSDWSDFLICDLSTWSIANKCYHMNEKSGGWSRGLFHLMQVPCISSVMLQDSFITSALNCWLAEDPVMRFMSEAAKFSANADFYKCFHSAIKGSSAESEETGNSKQCWLKDLKLSNSKLLMHNIECIGSILQWLWVQQSIHTAYSMESFATHNVWPVIKIGQGSINGNYYYH